jgi:hypothetical protein
MSGQRSLSKFIKKYQHNIISNNPSSDWDSKSDKLEYMILDEILKSLSEENNSPISTKDAEMALKNCLTAINTHNNNEKRIQSKRRTTGRHETREELIYSVCNMYYNKKSTITSISIINRISTTTIKKILNGDEGLNWYKNQKMVG